MNMVFKFLLLLTLIHVTLNAEHVRWLGNFDKAHQKALKEDKNLFVFLIEKECENCTKMLIESFSSQSYIKQINKQYVSVMLYQDQIDSYPIEMLYTQEYPSLFLLDKQEIFISKPIFGYVESKDVEKFLFP